MGMRAYIHVHLLLSCLLDSLSQREPSSHIASTVGPGWTPLVFKKKKKFLYIKPVNADRIFIETNKLHK
jgi:hypothetical protein